MVCFMGNAELRWKVVRFKWIKNNFYLGLNAFSDFGRVTKMVDIKSKVIFMSSIPQPSYFNWDAEKNALFVWWRTADCNERKLCDCCRLWFGPPISKMEVLDFIWG